MVYPLVRKKEKHKRTTKKKKNCAPAPAFPELRPPLPPLPPRPPPPRPAVHVFFCLAASSSTWMTSRVLSNLCTSHLRPVDAMHDEHVLHMELLEQVVSQRDKGLPPAWRTPPLRWFLPATNHANTPAHSRPPSMKYRVGQPSPVQSSTLSASAALSAE